jgi:hypothetical protein
MSFTQDVNAFVVQGPEGAAAAAFDKIVPEDSVDIIGSVVSSSARQNIYSTGQWDTQSAWTTYYHSWQDANSITQGWNMFMGDGYPHGGGTQKMYVNDNGDLFARKKEYAYGDRMGFHYRDLHYENNNSGQYAGITTRVTPIRNTTSSPITKTLNMYMSTSSASYGGGFIQVYTPSGGAKYSQVTSGTWSNSWQGGTDTQSTHRSGTITVPGNTTVLVATGSSHQYRTTYRYKDTNMLMDLDELITGGLVCDLRMLESLATMRSGQEETSETASPWRLYPLCATYYGDR